MRALVVRPGPNFSVADVAHGWVAGLREIGCDVVDFNFDDRLSFYSNALMERETGIEAALPDLAAAVRMAAYGIEAACYEFWPDIVIVVSGFFVPGYVYRLARERGHRVVVVCTESPYEDDRQVQLASLADVMIVNDPTNLDRFRAENAATYYLPHAYDPALHHPQPATPDLVSDFAFVGTGYPSRIEFLEQVDWTGVDVALGGNWERLDEDSPLRKFLAHDVEVCCDNTDTVALYTSTKASANIYRQEANDPGLSAGWAMGPREVELAACGTFFLRDRRPEGDELFPMLPVFDGPDDFEAQLRWWLAHDTEREAAASAARAVVVDRTFAANAATLLRLLERQTHNPSHLTLRGGA